MSPARLLARSLTDCETRGEWVSEYKSETALSTAFMSFGTHYKNALRDLTISRTYSTYGNLYITTPFTLNQAEQDIVSKAMSAFDLRSTEDKQAEALARLTAPREGLKPVRAETVKHGSVAKPRKPDPKGRAPKVKP